MATWSSSDSSRTHEVVFRNACLVKLDIRIQKGISCELHIQKQVYLQEMQRDIISHCV